MDALSCFAVLWRLLAFLQPCLGISDARFLSFQAISTPGSNKINIPYLRKDSIELYKITTTRYVRHPSISEMCNYVMTKKMFKFRVGKKEFLVYPLDKVIQRKDNVQKILGYFDRITTVNNSVVLRYKNGDKSILGPLYSSTVYIQSSQQESYDARFKETPASILLSLNVSEPLIYDREAVLGVYRRSSDTNTIIETVLEEQSREGSQKKLPSSILKQLGLGMEIPSEAGRSLGTESASGVVDNASLRRIARKFKKDLDMAQRTPVSAAEDMVSKSLRAPFQGSGQDTRQKHSWDEKYETTISSRDMNGDQGGIEEISRMLSRYFHTMPFSQSSHASTVDVLRPKHSTETFDGEEEDNTDKPQDAVDRQH